MKIPNEFFKFCLCLHQDFLLNGPEPQDWIKGALECVQREHRPALSAFVNELLTGGYSDAELQQIYRSTDAELRIWDDRGVRPFLAMVLDITNASMNEH